MLKNKTKIIIGILIFLVIIIFNAKVSAIDISQVEYTEEYKQWLDLPEEKREQIIAPKMFEIEVENSGNKFLSKLKTLKSSFSGSKFDLRDTILKNLEIKNQGSSNTCWAFATLSSLETNLAIQDNRKVYDYSESHMDYSTSNSFTDGELENGFVRQVSQGGNFQIGSAYLTNGCGAVLEEDMPFVDTMKKVSIKDIENKKVVTKVTDTEEFYLGKYINSNSMTSVELEALIIKMKEHIKTNGSISAGIHGANLNSNCYNNLTGAIYCKDEKKCSMDHNVSIIGWDDNYLKTNFNNSDKINSNGAWIIRNSWGTEVNGKKIGDNGFMYVSYEDVNIYKQLFGIEKARESVDYDNIYQYNELGYNNLLTFGKNKIYIGNVFARDSKVKEKLTEVSLNVMQNVKCKVYINPNGDSKDINDLIEVELAEGKTETFDAGYHTLEFKNPIKLTNSKFVVIIEIEAISDENIYCPIIAKTNGNFWDNVEVKKEASYITYGEYFENNEWIDTVVNASDIGIVSCNLTIKAFTKEIEIKKLNPGTIVEKYKEKNSDIYEIYNKKGEKQEDNAIIGTGYTMIIYDEQEKGEEITIIVKGDVTGDGKANYEDSARIIYHRLEKEMLQGEYESAADINSDGRINGIDSTMLIYHRLGMDSYKWNE